MVVVPRRGPTPLSGRRMVEVTKSGSSIHSSLAIQPSINGLLPAALEYANLGGFGAALSAALGPRVKDDGETACIARSPSQAKHQACFRAISGGSLVGIRAIVEPSRADARALRTTLSVGLNCESKSLEYNYYKQFLAIWGILDIKTGKVTL